ncbi:MAG: zf-HC2 domain-containing protein [Archangium sp.]|nr:zf-HC2 domain-containing protein [Archangium sp.]
MNSPTSSSLQDDLTAYIDGELSPERTKEVEAALAADPALRAMEQKLRRSISAVEALPSPVSESSAAMRRAVLNAVGEPTWKEKWLRWPVLMPVAGLAAAAAVTLVVWPRGVVDEAPAGLDEEKLLLAQNLEVVEDLDLVGLESPEDLDVVADLDELEVMR